jgi:DUF1365 family protein
MNASLYTGTVWHARHTPRKHQFEYRLFMAWLDLDHLDEIFRGRLCWSHRFPTLAWFRRKDHVGDPAVPLVETIRAAVAAATGTRPAGPVRLLTHLRYFGFYMNPISLYYCYDASDSQVETVVAEVHNTPWNERHLYFWPGEVCRDPQSAYRCAKAFHVSPFMEMNHVYRCRLNEPGNELDVQLHNVQNGAVVFGAGMRLTCQPWTTPRLAWTLLTYPFLTLRIFIAIYWQALRLWIKGVPFQPYPKRIDPLEESKVP